MAFPVRQLKICSLIFSRCSNDVLILRKPLLNRDFLVKCRYSSSQTGSATFSRNANSWTGRLAMAVGVGMAAGAGYSAFQLFAKPDRTERYPEDPLVDTADGLKKHSTSPLPENLKITRKVGGPTDFLGIELFLFQYQSCPFCCKVRAFLEYFGIPYSQVEVHPLSRSEIKFSEYKGVPIVMVKDAEGHYHQLNDSSAIVSILSTYLLNPDQSLLNSTLSKYKSITYVDEETKKKVTEVMNRYFILFDDKFLTDREMEMLDEERTWRQWVDNHLVHVISPNIYRSLEESKETFRQFSVNGGWEDIFSSLQITAIIHAGAFVMYLIGKKLKKKYHLKNDVRESLYEAINDWTNALDSRPFMGGATPNLADLAVYGVLSSFEGCRAFKDMETETDLSRWYNDVKYHIRAHTGSSQVPKPKFNK